MKILLSGASSFTGYWFGKTLSAAGHEVVGLYRRSAPSSYDGVRRRRVNDFGAFAKQEFDCTFGSDRFLKLAEEGGWDIYCHHASKVTNYRSPEFDPISATSANTLNLPVVLKALKKGGCSKLIFTGSVFENDEGLGNHPLRAFSRYGLSKTMSWKVFEFECQVAGSISLGKFVIPNPFGPLEEKRFISFLADNWRDNKSATCHTPLYVRDNIPVDLLAIEYRRYVEEMPPGFSKCHPSGYVETQGVFTERVAREFRERTKWECGLVSTEQSDFSQPLVRINSESAGYRHPAWDESGFWDQLVEYYSAESIR